jgi:hypothetical protein
MDEPVIEEIGRRLRHGRSERLDNFWKVRI